MTHGDFDYSGNAAYLQNKFRAQVAVHKEDSGMVEHGDMVWSRKHQNVLTKLMFKLLFRLKKSDRLKPDLLVYENYDLSKHGFDAKVLETPGHSLGSIAILTSTGELFCGDLLANTKKPEVWSIVDDKKAMKTSVEKLKKFRTCTVYPGHGKPFQMEEFIKTHQY